MKRFVLSGFHSAACEIFFSVAKINIQMCVFCYKRLTKMLSMLSIVVNMSLFKCIPFVAKYVPHLIISMIYLL